MTQTAKLTASDGAADDHFGCSVAISGNTVVVGADGATVGSNSGQGAAYVFTEPGSGWTNMTQTAKLTASDGAAGDDFGYSVSISGNTVVVGAPRPRSAATATRGRPTCSRSPAPVGPDMTQTAKLTASDGAAGDDFGNSVSISGNTVVVGAPDATVSGTAPGGGLRVHGARLRLDQHDPDRQAHRVRWRGGRLSSAYSVSISGNTVVVGAPVRHGRQQRRPGGGLRVHGARLRLGEHDPDRQAHRVRWRGGRRFRLLGFDQRQHGGGRSATATVGGNGYQGAAYVFTEPGSGWASMTQTAELTASDGAAMRLFRQLGFHQRQHVVVGAPRRHDRRQQPARGRPTCSGLTGVAGR